MVFNPKLEKEALVILSNNDGCILARSAKAKAAGVKMGDPSYLYRDRADIKMLSANFALYSDMSQRVMQVLSHFSSDMEIYSIDEAFLLLEESEKLEEEALAMREKVKKWTGLPVSIGIARTKTLAKLACEAAKKGNGVHVLRQEEELLEKTALNDIWGIGSGTTAQLKRKGVYTALQLCKTDDTLIQKWLGVTGLRTVLELRGTSCFELSDIPEKKQSIICSRSFGKKVKDLESLQEAVATFAAQAAEKLRDQESLAGFLSVSLMTGQDGGTCHIQIPNATSYTPELISLAKEGAAKIYKPGQEYKKAGVMLGDFSDEGALQNDFLTERKDKADVMKVLDQINARYDKQAIRFAAEGMEKPWKGRRSNSTPKFTTSWSELLKVFAI